MSLLLLALLSPPAPWMAVQDEFLVEYEIQMKVDMWKGFKEGSWVQRKIVQKDGSGKLVAEYRITLDRIAENGYCFKMELLEDGKVEETKLRVKEVYHIGDVFETEKQEEVKIGDRTFKCFVQEYKTEGENATLQRTFESAEAPGIVVKTIYEATFEGKKSLVTQEIVGLNVEQAVGDKKVTCWKIEKKSDMPGSKATITALFSKDVPGGVVLRESQTQWGDWKTNTVDTLVAFEVKK
jgi:hypothetical protein